MYRFFRFLFNLIPFVNLTTYRTEGGAKWRCLWGQTASRILFDMRWAVVALFLIVPSIIFAQDPTDVLLPDAPATVDLWVEQILALATDGQSAWWLLAAVVVWGLFQVLKGRVGFAVPFVTEWWSGQSNRVKAIVSVVVVLGVGGLVGVPAGAKGIVLGLLTGLKVAAGAGWIQMLVKTLSGKADTE